MFRSFLRTFVVHYFFIYALTMIVSFFFVLIGGEHDSVPLDYFWQAALFSLAADAPLAIYLSKNELTSKQFMIRTVIHAAVLEAVLMPLGYFFGMWRGVGGGFIFFFVVLAVDAAVHTLQYIGNKRVSDEINNELKKRRENAAPSKDDGTASNADNTSEDKDGRSHE